MMQSRQIALHRQSFHLLQAGSETAPALLFLHGFPEYSGAWTELVERLASDFFCLAPDQRGYGQSWAPAEIRAYALRHLVGDMAALLERLGRKATVVGHDWGASVAYGLAIARPDLVSRLVIMNGVHPVPFQRALAAGGAQSAASQYIHRLRRPGVETRLAEEDYALLLKTFSAQMDIRWLTADRLAGYRTAWARPGRLTGMLNWYRASPLVVADPGRPLRADRLPALDPVALRVRVPHLLIWGADDTALLPEATAGLEDLCEDVTRLDIPGTDHWLHHQAPDAVADAIAAFAARA
ncbi:MAG: alpha/beta hydrolase [Pseudomonadota bacterium]